MTESVDERREGMTGWHGVQATSRTPHRMSSSYPQEAKDMLARLSQAMDETMEQHAWKAAVDFNVPGNIVYFENVPRTVRASEHSLLPKRARRRAPQDIVYPGNVLGTVSAGTFDDLPLCALAHRGHAKCFHLMSWFP